MDRGFGSGVLGHVRLGAAGQVVVEQPGGLAGHQRSQLDLGLGLGQRVLERLIRTDGAIEHHPLVGVLHRPAHRIAADTAADGTDQDALGVEALEQDLETLAHFAEDVLRTQVDIIEEHLILHLGQRHAHRDGMHLDALGLGIHDEQGEAVGLALDLGVGRGAGDHQSVIGLLAVGNIGLAAVELEAAVGLGLGDGAGTDGVGTGIGLGDREAEADVATAGGGQVLLLLRLGAVHADRPQGHGGADHQAEQRHALIGQSLHEQFHLEHAQTGAAVLLGHHDAHKAVRGDLLVHGFRKGAPLGVIHPVGAVVGLGQTLAVLVDHGLFLAQFKVHHCLRLAAARDIGSALL